MNELKIKRRNINCIIPVWPLQHEKISLQAKGLLAMLLSFPDDWTINMRDIISRSRNGRDATRAALKELIELGYVYSEHIRDPKTNRCYGSRYYVTDEPTPKSRKTGFQSPGNAAI